MIRKKLVRIIYIVIFMAIMIIPFILANRKNNQISETEKRYLSNLPTAKVGTEEWKNQLNEWLEDNLAFRDEFMKLRTSILYKGFNLVLSDKVERGKEGWLFLTVDDNVKIAKGEYILDENMLKEIAEVQQAIHRYYEKMGKTYVLLLIPSKGSIYPEYLYGGVSDISTPCDILAEYLSEHTDVIVINSKEELLANKKAGTLYWKTDTHPTTLGSYYIYQSIINVLNREGLAEIEAVKVEKSKQIMNTDLLYLMGLKEKEENDAINLKFNSLLVDEMAIAGINTKDLYVYENRNIDSEQKFLIYGTSHMEPIRKIPQLLGEHFSNVTFLKQDKIGSVYEIDVSSEADIVMCAVGERSMKAMLNYLPEHIPVIIPDVELREEQSMVCIDFCNGINVASNRQLIAEAMKNAEEECTLSGWAADIEKKVNIERIYLKLGEHIVKGTYGGSRKDVAGYYQSDALVDVGFAFNLKKEYMYNEKGELLDSFEIICISKDGTYMYQPVKYNLGGVE